MGSKPVLSEDEIDSLMGASAETGAAAEVGSTTSRYDFLGREKKLFSQMPGLRELNEKVCNDFANLVSEKLRVAFEVKLDDVDIRDGENLENEFSENSIVSMAKLEPLQGFSLVEVPTALLSHITESYFGGTLSGSESSSSRPYSRSEVRVQTRLVSLFFKAIESGWSSAIKCRYELVSTETDIQFLRKPAANTKSVCISFALTQAEQSWKINWFFPYSSLEPLRETLGDSVQDSQETPRTDWSAAMRKRLMDVPVSASAVLLELEMGLGEVMQLKKGSIIPIRMPEAAQFKVEDISMMFAEYGDNESQKAVKLVGRIDES